MCEGGNARLLKRQAASLIALLPDDPEEAKAVLRYAEKIVTDFIQDEDEDEKGHRVLPFVRPASLAPQG